MNESKIRKSISKGLMLIVSTIIMLIVFAAGVFAATPYEITKSGGALVRTSYSEKASEVRREATGNIIWIVSSFSPVFWTTVSFVAFLPLMKNLFTRLRATAGKV